MRTIRYDVYRLSGVLGLWRCQLWMDDGRLIGLGIAGSRYLAVRRACRDAGSRRGLRVQ